MNAPSKYDTAAPDPGRTWRQHLREFPRRLKKRLMPLFDLTFWFLTIISCLPLWFIDPPMVKTLLQWSAYVLALGGLSVLVSRSVFPQVNLAEWLTKAADGNIAAGLVVLGVSVLQGFIVLSVILWAKT